MIDKQIGLKIKDIRKGLGFSQMELAERIGLSFQQVQKYEKGATRISVMRLQQISEALDVSITDFIGEGPKGSKVSDYKPGYGNAVSHREVFQILNKEEKTLLRLFRRVKNKKIREGILRQLRGVVELEGQKKNTP